MQTDGKVVLVSSKWPRSLFIGSSLCTLALAVKTPSSMTAVLVMANGFVGAVAAAVFAAALLFLMLDFFVHDMLPSRFSFAVLRNYRWLCISAMSTVYWMFGTISLLPGKTPVGAWVLIAWFFLIGVWGMSFSFSTKVGQYKRSLCADTP